MNIQPIPRNLLIHSIEYSALNGTDDFDHDLYDAPITINRVRFDPTINFSRDGNQTLETITGVIFVDATNSENVPNEFIERSQVNFNGRRLVITNVIPCYQPYNGSIRHYELEVV